MSLQEGMDKSFCCHRFFLVQMWALDALWILERAPRITLQMEFKELEECS